MEDYTDAKKNLGSKYGSNVSLVITPELELCFKLLSPSESMRLLKALTATIRGEYVELDDMDIASSYAYEFFTGPDYNIKDLILPRLSK